MEKNIEKVGGGGDGEEAEAEREASREKQIHP